VGERSTLHVKANSVCSAFVKENMQERAMQKNPTRNERKYTGTQFVFRNGVFVEIWVERPAFSPNFSQSKPKALFHQTIPSHLK
jgi:hypothetical protein